MMHARDHTRRAAQLLLLYSRLIVLLDDEFITAESAPLASPRTCEPGPGTLTLVQTDGQFSIAAGVMAYPAQVSPVAGDQGFIYATGFARIAGRSLLSKSRESANPSTGIQPLAWFATAALPASTTAGVRHAIYPNSGTSLSVIAEGGFLTPSATYAVATDFEYAIVLREMGAFYFIKGGTYLDWTLFWVDVKSTTTPMYPGFSNFFATGTLDYFQIRDLYGALASDFGIATITDTTLASGDTLTGTANATSDFEFTLPGATLAGDEIVLRYRRTDDNNCWKAYVLRNATNTAWDVRLDSVAAGIATNRIAVTGVGSPDMIRVIHRGALHDLFTKAGTVWTKRASQVNMAHQNTVTFLSIEAVAGTTLTRVTSWPYTSSSYDILSAT